MPIRGIVKRNTRDRHPRDRGRPAVPLGQTERQARRAKQTGWVLAGLCLLSAGCLAHHGPVFLPPPEGTVPVELKKTTLPPYVIEPPDILLIEVTLPPRDIGEPARLLSPQPVAGQHIVRID